MSYTTEAFESYLESMYESRDGPHIYPPPTAMRLRDSSLEQWGIDPESGQGMLAAVTTIAAGFQPSAASQLLTDRGLGLDDNFQAIADSDLSDVEAEGEWHSHRRHFGKDPREALNCLSDLSVDGTAVNSMAGAVDQLADTNDPFNSAIDCFSSLDTFGHLAAFDTVDFLVRVSECDVLVPDQLEPGDLHSGSDGTPRGTLEQLCDTRDRDKEAILGEFVEYAEESIGVDHSSAVLDVESCLCTFDGDPGADSDCCSDDSCDDDCGTTGSEIC